ncbi:MAG TPA: PDZ domain-containing protein [Candidatus Limnocylindria bacterium]|nr:PDZ domain-containing protein [Candidatus Limnocylindria bacterium]HTL68222.1 PDZ domain-containing protein [Lacunisphaera sp.]
MRLLRPLFVVLLLAAGASRAATLPELFQERLKSVVEVEFFIQSEIDRQPVMVLGTVVDDQGTIVLPGPAIQPTVAPGQLKEFKVYRAGNTEATRAEYLGQDAYTGWHFIRVEPKLRGELVPITHWPAMKSAPALSEELWGIGLRGKDEDFLPYFLSSRVATVMKLPQETAICGSDVAGPGLPVFNTTGEFAGLALPSFGQNYLVFSRNQHGSPIMLVNIEESSAVQLAREVLPYLHRIPETVSGRPLPWFGAYGLQPMDPDVAKLLKLENQSGVVLSDIASGTPAEQAGLRDRDIVLAIDGSPLPRLKPDRIVAGYFSQQILLHRPGDTLNLTILRGSERKEVTVTLGSEPKLVREAERHYFDRLGVTVREFLNADAISMRVAPTEHRGVVAHFIKPGGPAATAGLRPEDWIREIDGTEITSYQQALDLLHAVEVDKERSEVVFLVGRGAETAVIRVKLI